MWLYILTTISAVMFFGFVIFCVCRFGLQTCYSAYGPLCRDTYKVNWWSVVTIASAVLLMPVLLELSIGKVWQFTGFLCVVFIALVGTTPDYDRNKFVLVLHLIGAQGGALWAILYIVFNATQWWWVMFAYLAACGIMILITGKKYWNFWLEMAAFLMTWTVVYLMIGVK